MMFVIRSRFTFHSSSPPSRCKKFSGKGWGGGSLIHLYVGAFGGEGESQSKRVRTEARLRGHDKSTVVRAAA